MARVFISHAGADTETAAEVHRWLVDDGHEVFLDRDSRDGIQLGDEWEQRLHERLRWSDAVVCVVTSAYLESPWCAAEVGAARSRGSRMLPVVAEPGVVHPLLRPVQHTNMARDPAAARRALSEALRRVDAAGGVGWPDGTSPFPGLVAFDSALRHVFFGRSEEIGRLLELLRSPVERADGAFHLVIGPSGCGKSSLVRAGLAPALAEEPGWWTAPPFVPGTDPVGALARSVAATARQVGLDWTIADVRARLDESGLTDAAGEVLLASPGGTAERLLVVVDQLEELLTQTAPAERARFAELIRGALSGPVLVVATLRSEFLDRFLTLPELADLRPRLHPVQPLRRRSLDAVIRGPARVAGISVEDELVDRLVADTDDGAALPLLAFTLAEMAVDVGRGGELSAERYDELGGVRGALTLQADAALAAAKRVKGRSQDDVVAGLVQLVTVDEQDNRTSQRVYRSELPAAVNAELDAFVARHLLVTGADDDGSAVIGVAHEAFLTAWPPLKAAIDKQASALRARTAVERGAEEWNRSGRSNDRLWERGRLAAVVNDTGARVRSGDVVTAHVPVNEKGRQFLLASIRRDRLRRGRATTILAGLCALALAAAGIAFVQQQTAQQQQRVATARQLVAQADLIRGSDPQTALMLGIAAEHLHSDADTRGALTGGLLTSRYAGSLTGHTGEVAATAFTADDRMMSTGDADGTLILWDIRGERPVRLGPPVTASGALLGLEFSSDGRALAATRSGGTVELWDVTVSSAPRVVGRPVPAPEHMTHVRFSPDGRVLALGSQSMVELWDVSDPARAHRLGTPVTLPTTLELLEFHPSGTALITATSDIDGSPGEPAGVVVWDISDPGSPRPIGPPIGRAGAAAFHPGKRLLATTTGPSSTAVAVWDLTDPAAPRQLPDDGRDVLARSGLDDGSVRLLRFSPDGALLAVTSSTSASDATSASAWWGTVQLWDLTGPFPRPRYEERGFVVDATIDDVTIAPDNEIVATVSGSDSIVTLWDLVDPAKARQIDEPIAGTSGNFRTVALLPNGSRLLTGRGDGSIIVWAISDSGIPRLISPLVPGTGKEVSALAFFPVSDTLSVSYLDGSVELYTTAGPTGPTRFLPAKSESLADAVFAPRTGLIAATDADGSIVVTDALDASRAGRISQAPPGDAPNSGAKPLGFSLDGWILAVNSTPTATNPGRHLTLWDVRDPTLPRSVGAPSVLLDADSVATFSPDGRTLAVGLGRGAALGVELIDISDPAQPKPIGILAGHTAVIDAIAFTPDSAVLAAGGEDMSVILWDVADPTRARRLGSPLTAHSVGVTSLVASSDGRTLASGDSAGNIILWDLTNPERPRRVGHALRSREGTVTALLLSEDGNRLVSGHFYGSTISWDLTGLNALRQNPRIVACERTGRGLDPDEWRRYVGELAYMDTCSP
jgi:WD40 repeat protein